MSEPDEDVQEETDEPARGNGPVNDGTAQGLELLGHAGAGGCGQGRSMGDSCDVGCDPGCHFLLLPFPRLSTLLLLTAALAPRRGSGRLARALIVFYRRFLTRWTPKCPATPSCSAYALDAINRLGTRRGLVAAATRIRNCG